MDDIHLLLVLNRRSEIQQVFLHGRLLLLSTKEIFPDHRTGTEVSYVYSIDRTIRARFRQAPTWLLP
jgi:hypothetical protein